MEQRGFVNGRSILANVVDVDSYCMESAATCPAAALLLFDFEAAFHSTKNGTKHMTSGTPQHTTWYKHSSTRLVESIRTGFGCDM